jgi:NADH-quinone oxidoreductase subunit L
MLSILIILPLAIAAILSLIMQKHSKYIKYIALAAGVISFLLIISAYLSPGQLQNLAWFSFSGYTFTLTVSTMPLNMLLLLLVGAITPLIVLYSIGFMNLPSEQSRYYSELLVFATAMMLFAMSGDFITMLIGWELLGVTSYLLIGFWYGRKGTADAARKAITTILIGDILMFFAIIIIWNSYHTFSFALLLQQTSLSSPMTVALLLIMFAVFTKSAQFPFHEWLADAMKGPTPVSAFLHSSTMVKAGVFLIAILLPLFAAYHLLYLLLIFGIITSIIGATNAIAEKQIKRVLAYSTIEDLGLMFVALGLGSLVAAIMLFVVQTFYKALLFMSSGAMIRANDGEEEMEKMQSNPSYFKLSIPIVIGVASLAGLYPLGGFFGKAAIISNVNNIFVYAILLVIELASSIYIFRWLFIPFRKKQEINSKQAMASYKATPKSMIIPIYILAIFAVVSGFVAYSYLPGYLSQYGARPFPISIIDIGVSIFVIVVGLLISYKFFYLKSSSQAKEDGLIYKLLYNNIATNKFYEYLASAVLNVSNAVDSFDYSLYNLIKEAAHNLGSLGNLIKKMESGDTNTYLIVFLIGMVIIVAIFIL